MIARTNISYKELENVTKENIGKVAIFWPMGPTMATGENVEDAIAEFNTIGRTESQSHPLTEDDLTEYTRQVTTENLCYAEIVH